MPAAGQHCLLSGPDDNKADLLSGLPAGVSASEGEIVTVPQGTVVLQAIPSELLQADADRRPERAVLRAQGQRRAARQRHHQPAAEHRSQHGEPDVTFGFSGKGKNAFQNVTAKIAHRGDLVSGLGQTLNQHFAVALDNKLITVP